jgi:hypothetical protein
MMDSKQIKNVFGITMIILCIAAGIWGIIRQKKLKSDHKVCVAYVYKFNAGGRGNAGGIWIDFTIDVNGKTYGGSTLYRVSDISTAIVDRYMLHKTFPAVYNPNNPSISSLMVLPDDFKSNGYVFPDSLNWILPHLNDPR